MMMRGDDAEQGGLGERDREKGLICWRTEREETKEEDTFEGQREGGERERERDGKGRSEVEDEVGVEEDDLRGATALVV